MLEFIFTGDYEIIECEDKKYKKLVFENYQDVKIDGKLAEVCLCDGCKKEINLKKDEIFCCSCYVGF